MPSSSKHTYTKSAATSETCAGNRGKTALIHAIELLFFVKSAEFRKYHPSFITPCAEEFLDYIQLRYRKHVVLPTRRHRPLSSSSSSSPSPPSVLFKQFIGFIHAPAAKSSIQSLIGCLHIIIESLSLYGIVKLGLSASPVEWVGWRSAFCSASFMDEFTAPIFWLLEHKMPTCFVYRHELITKLTHPLVKNAGAILDAMPSRPEFMLEVMCQQYIHAFQTIMSNNELYRIQFVSPIIFLFGSRGGVPCCKEFCESVIKNILNTREGGAC
jgi:hypothetical protein